MSFRPVIASSDIISGTIVRLTITEKTINYLAFTETTAPRPAPKNQPV
jgi:hypothetical protein